MKRMLRHANLIGILLAGAVHHLPAEAAGSDAPWPGFHGPRRDNISSETGLLAEWPQGGPRLLWRYTDCGKGYACVSAAEGLLFTSGDFGDQEAVLALDLDGKLKWKALNGRAWRGAQPGARTTPTFSEGLVFHLGPHGDLSAFEAATGRRVWTVNVRERFGASLGLWGYTENLVVDGDRVFCMPGGEKGRVVALEKRTGRVIWANTEITDRAGYSSPIVAVHRGLRQLIILARSSVLGVEVENGRLLWVHEHKGFCDQNVTSPIYEGGRVFVSSGHKAGARVIELGVGGGPVRQVWFGTRLDNCHGGVLLLDGHLYGSGCRMYNPGLHCVEFATGQVVYQAKELGKLSLTYADDRLYCLDNDGEVLLVKASPQGATVLSRFKLPRPDEEHTLSHPVVCGGRLYLRHHGDLFAYDVRGPGRP